MPYNLNVSGGSLKELKENLRRLYELLEGTHKSASQPAPVEDDEDEDDIDEPQPKKKTKRAAKKRKKAPEPELEEDEDEEEDELLEDEEDEEEEDDGPTQDQVDSVLRKMHRKTKNAALCTRVLKKFGASKSGQIKSADRAKFIAACEKEIKKVSK